MDYFLGKRESPKLTQEDENKLPVTITEIENDVEEYFPQCMRFRNFR